MRTRMDRLQNKLLLVIIKKIAVFGIRDIFNFKKYLVVIYSLSTRKPLSDCFQQNIWGFLLMIHLVAQMTGSCKGLRTVDMHPFAWYWQLTWVDGGCSGVAESPSCMGGGECYKVFCFAAWYCFARSYTWQVEVASRSYCRLICQGYLTFP